ncbi:hypothetical protein GUJ93_ZPchr0009g2077 [Zizania palustris]|uniref:Uncharacterized protein n=1 Tax=Zizania palustris TaxID=103762 RepID=A0A8J5RWR0_ZIZPA|nr:hypothetical protein GUJ93_ZPchr0009g2077 [Zizania palustris]
MSPIGLAPCALPAFPVRHRWPRMAPFVLALPMCGRWCLLHSHPSPLDTSPSAARLPARSVPNRASTWHSDTAPPRSTPPMPSACCSGDAPFASCSAHYGTRALGASAHGSSATLTLAAPLAVAQWRPVTSVAPAQATSLVTALWQPMVFASHSAHLAPLLPTPSMAGGACSLRAAEEMSS